ncbi:hypothetical protein SALBM217S_06840 [Streptomyces griseoloalbus]
MHGEYKVPGGKLVVVDVDVADGVLRDARVAGDFFLEPDEALDAVNRALEGAPADTDAAGLAARIEAALPEGTVMYGLTAEGVGIAVRRALAHATDWTDYDWQLVHEGPQPPALHMALDEVLTAEVAAMACADWPDGGQREDRATAVPTVGEDRWDGPGWYSRWRSQHDGDPRPVASGSPSASASPSKDARRHHDGKPSRKPTKKATEAGAAPSTSTAAPKPTTASPKPSTAAPEPSTAASAPSTTAPRPTTPAPKPTTASPKPTATASGAVARVVELVNAERAEAGCSPVTANSTLNTAAQRHSEDMASTGTMSHTGSDGSDPGQRITRAGYTWSTYGENVAYGDLHAGAGDAGLDDQPRSQGEHPQLLLQGDRRRPVRHLLDAGLRHRPLRSPTGTAAGAHTRRRPAVSATYTTSEAARPTAQP